MNVFVVDPEWGGWIIAYFFLGGIAAGAYFTASLIDLVAGDRALPVTRIGYTLALPLIAICGLLLTVDLGRPERFWHMLFKSEVVRHGLAAGWPVTGEGWRLMQGAPIYKPWSPMSIGSWFLSLFGLCSSLSLIGVWWPDSRWTRWLHRGPFALTLRLLGGVAGFFIAAYTGTLLSATNQPLWSDTIWISPLFLASAASTGIALMLLISYLTGAVTVELREHLERADLWAVSIELLVFIGFVASLAPWLGVIWETAHGKLLLAGTLLAGVLLPLLLQGLHLRVRRPALVPIAALCALLGGFFLRYGLLHMPPELLARGQEVLARERSSPVATPLPPGDWVRVSPEDGRPPGGGPGADPMNRPAELMPRSKIPAFAEGE
jgi:formate-dependent nitrite reductase membrane component NrfD